MQHKSIMVYRRQTFFHLFFSPRFPLSRYFLSETHAIARRSELNVLIFRRQRRVPAAEPSFDFPLGFLRRLIVTQTRTRWLPRNSSSISLSLSDSSRSLRRFNFPPSPFCNHIAIINKFLLSLSELKIKISRLIRVLLLQMFIFVSCLYVIQSTNEPLDI